ncbi:MAG: gamma-glutamylcyclotransferase [Planctomycetes bacterium]|nr:gamma-glutamylcyclotransferase [Planctomycetota bacterium]
MADAEDLLGLLLRVNVLRHGPRSAAATAWLTDTEARLARDHHTDHHLLVYGSLAPGECNHHRVEPWGGVWSYATVPGTIVQRRWKEFSWQPDGPPLPMRLLTTPSPIDWRDLDEFEADEDYRRIIVLAATDHGPLLGNVYEAPRR